MEQDFNIWSVKFSEPFYGTEEEAIDRAGILDEEYQPAFGTCVTRVSDDTTVWDSNDGGIY